MADGLEELRDFIAQWVREGFESVHEIVENAADRADDRYDRGELLPTIRRLTAELLEAHTAEQTGWRPTTDCDRLDEAFAALEWQGIVARQDFSCCNNCGFSEIWDEIEEIQKQRPVEGYVFYHLQCTERAVKAGQVLMAYGCLKDDPRHSSGSATGSWLSCVGWAWTPRGAARQASPLWSRASSGVGVGDNSASAYVTFLRAEG